VGKAEGRFTWTALALIWGSTWLFIKVGLEDLPPFSFAGIRFAVAVVPLVLYLAWKRVPLPRSFPDWALLLATAPLTVSLGYGLVFWGEQYIPSGLTSVLFSTYPMFGLFYAHFLLESEPLAWRKVLGAALGIGGVAVIFADQFRLAGASTAWGSLAVLASAAAGSFSGVMVKKWGSHLEPAVVSTVQMTVGGIPLLLIGFWREGSPLDFAWTPKAVVSLLYLALAGTSLTFILWYRLLQTTEVTRAQVMPLLNTVVAVVLGAVVLGEHYGPREGAGIVAVVCGLALLFSTKARERRSI
jgi:drug/metabolite transporter (DMT)-like permease